MRRSQILPKEMRRKDPFGQSSPIASALDERGFSLVEPKRSEVPAQAGIHLPQGFSLVELAIVLVILGLLTGGILAGQSLIRAAELRSVSTDHARYITAVAAFRDKYFAYPGDMANATAFWGVQHATPATCYTTASTSALTCNGDGNGVVDGVSGGDIHELFRFWQHLANAGLIEGRFTGANGTSGCWINVTAENAPAS